MGFIPARCTQCGAEIKVDDKKDAGICEHCGTPFVTEKVIKNFNTYISNNFNGATINVLQGDVNNLLKLAQAAIESHNGKMAFDYANKVIEINSRSVKAWIIKMQAIFLMGTISELRASEIVSCGDDAIACADENEMEKTKHCVTISLLNMAFEWMKNATQKIGDTTQLSLMNLTDYGSKTSMVYKDIAHRNLAFKYVEGCGELVSSIPKEYIDEYQDLKKTSELIAQEYLKYQYEENKRLSLYDGKLSPNEVGKRKQYLYLFHVEKEELKDWCSLKDVKINSLGDEGIFGKLIGFLSEL